MGVRDSAETGVGSKKALKEDQFKDKRLTYNMVQPPSSLIELKVGGAKPRVDAPRDQSGDGWPGRGCDMRS